MVKDSQILVIDLHQSIMKLGKGDEPHFGHMPHLSTFTVSVGTGTRPWPLSAGRHATGRDQAGLGDRSAFQ